MNRTRFASLVFLALISLTGCKRGIGDDCETNVQCSNTGDRQCDQSQPGGYCTIEGCDERSCPDDAICVRFFPVQALRADRTCDPATESQMAACTAREICIAEGFCVEPRLEHRFCMKPCGSMSDCRQGYECRRTGSGGAELLPDSSGKVPVAAFCTASATGTTDGGIATDAAAAPVDGGPDAPVQMDAAQTDAPPGADAADMDALPPLDSLLPDA